MDKLTTQWDKLIIQTSKHLIIHGGTKFFLLVSRGPQCSVLSECGNNLVCGVYSPIPCNQLFPCHPSQTGWSCLHRVGGGIKK